MPLSKIQGIEGQVTPNLGRRNLIINGAMQVAQRGTSATGVTSAGGAYLIDRINHNLSSAGTWSFSQDSDAPSGFTKSFKALCTTATGTLGAGGYLVFYQNFEGQDFQQLDYGSSSAKTVTLSFYVKSNKTGTYQVTFRATDGSTERHIGGTYTVNSSGVWERKTITYVGDTAQAIVNSNARGNTLEWWVVAGTTFTSGSSPTAWQNQVSADRAGGLNVNLGDATNNYWQVTGIQFEVGDTATDFEHRSYAEELSLCSRYYHTSFSGETTIGGSHPASYSGKVFSWCDQYGSSPDRVAFNYQWPVQMRDLPTVTMYGNQWTSARMSKYNGGNNEYTIDYASGVSRNGLSGYYDVAAGATGDFVIAYVEASAEL